MGTPVRKNFCQFTFAELIVVLMILISVAVIILPKLSLDSIQLGSEQKDAHQVTTELNMQIIFKAILGNEQNSGYYQDLRGFSPRMPRTLADLLRVPKELPSELQIFHPETQLGWRGPYLAFVEGRYGEKTATGYVFRSGFGEIYGQPSDPAILDAWGNPIVLQIEFDGTNEITEDEEKYARLVSAGPNGTIDTPMRAVDMIPGDDPATQLTLDECKDDIVLFLRVTDTRQISKAEK